MNNNKVKVEENQWDLLWLAILLVLFVAFVARADQLTGRDIMKKHQEVRKLANTAAAGKISTTGGGKKDNIKEFRWWRKLKSDGERYNTVTKFLKPAEVRDQAILFLELEGQKNDIQMYLPAYKKVRRVESNQQSTSFMGSEFSYSDIVTPHIDDYEYKLKKEETCPENKSKTCFVIDLKPATEAVSERSGVSRSVAWVEKDNFMIEKSEYYDREGKLWKVLTAKNFLPMPNNKLFVSSIKMKNVQTDRATDLEFSDVKADATVPDRMFTVQNLQSGL